jgi:hypothetical protein
MGAWLKVWQDELSVPEIFGLDGYHVQKDNLLIPSDSFQAHNLESQFGLGRTYDLVQSLEVAEHLHETQASNFVKSLTRHGSVVLFSAAPPGQGGHGHINERPYDYWRQLFEQEGYSAYDCLRPQLKDNPNIDPWYKYNIFIYASVAGESRLSDLAKKDKVPVGVHLRDISPSTYQLRKLLIRQLPPPLMTIAARLKERISTNKTSF